MTTMTKQPQDSGIGTEACDDRLIRHANFLNRLLDTIPVPVFFKDAQGRYRGGNSAWADKIMGLPMKEIVGRTIHELSQQIPNELADVYHKADLALMVEKGEQVYESRVQCADGEFRDFQFNKATILDSEGRAIGIIGVMADVTEKNLAQKILARESERYKGLIESQNMAVYRTKLDGEIIFANTALIEIFGYESLEELRKESSTNLYQKPTDREEIVSHLLLKGRMSRILSLKKKNGEAFRVHAMSILRGDEITGFLTELKSGTDQFLMVMCAACFKIREGSPEKGVWLPPSEFFLKHRNEIRTPETDYDFSHSICPKCGKELYGDLFDGPDE